MTGSAEGCRVWRNGVGPLPGIRRGNVAAYEFDVHPGLFTLVPPPAAPVRQRAFLLLDERVQLQQPVGFPPSHEGWWYVDLVSLENSGAEIRVTDDYLDVIVGPADRPYRVLDMDEYADALAAGKIDPDHVVEGLRAFQTFLDRHLNNEYEPSVTWRDFPPAALDAVANAEVPDPHAWAATTAAVTPPKVEESAQPAPQL